MSKRKYPPGHGKQQRGVARASGTNSSVEPGQTCEADGCGVLLTPNRWYRVDKQWLCPSCWRALWEQEET